MGLDIYLYETHGFEPKKVTEDGYSYNEWPDEMTEPRAWDNDHYASDIDPDHISNRRYLRSSYNASGFNSVCQDLIGKDYYWIFQPPTDEYNWMPTERELIAASGRAAQVVKELEAAPLYFVITEEASGFLSPREIPSAAEFIRTVDEELKRDHHFEGGYSNINGHFFPGKPLEVVAYTAGMGDRWGTGAKTPMIHMVCRSNDETRQHYVDAARIACQFIDEALQMKRPIIMWSS